MFNEYKFSLQNIKTKQQINLFTLNSEKAKSSEHEISPVPSQKEKQKTFIFSIYKRDIFSLKATDKSSRKSLTWFLYPCVDLCVFRQYFFDEKHKYFYICYKKCLLNLN